MAGRTVATTYDELSRPTGVTDSALEPTTTYTYGPTEITRADPAGSHVFTLDPFGRQVSLADPLTETEDNFAWEYQPTGAVGNMVDTTLNETTYSHDPLGRLTGIALSGSSACPSCLAYTYAYNAAGNRISATRTIGTEETTTTYGYDALSRLLNYDPTGTEADQSYGWDATPDRTSITRGTTTTDVLYDEASRVKGDTEHNASDLNGRVTKLPGSRESEVLVLAYDPLGRLTSADSSISGVPTATYTYDPLDRLASITTDDEVPQITTFAYVGLSNAVAQVSVASGSTSTVTRYTTDLAGSALMSFVVPTQGSIAPVFLGLDAHGDIAWTTNLGGALCDTAAYDPFGSIDSGSVPAGIRWQGSWQDSTTSLYYVVARWYSPVSGRFLSEDPLTADAATPQRRDAYPYGAGDPVDRVDTLGTCVMNTITWTCGSSYPAKSSQSSQAKSPVSDAQRLGDGLRLFRQIATYTAGRMGNDWIQLKLNANVHALDRSPISFNYWGVDWPLTVNNVTLLLELDMRFQDKRYCASSRWARFSGCAMWDLKPVIVNKFFGGRPVTNKTYPDTSTPVPGNLVRERISYDIWGNMHFGYIMAVFGIDWDHAYAAANRNHALQHDRGDRLSIRLGFELAARHGGHVSETDLEDVVRTHMSEYRGYHDGHVTPGAYPGDRGGILDPRWSR